MIQQVKYLDYTMTCYLDQWHADNYNDCNIHYDINYNALANSLPLYHNIMNFIGFSVL